MSAYTTENLHLVWEAAKASPFEPLIPQQSQLLIAFTLLISAIILTAVFALSMLPTVGTNSRLTVADRSLATLPILGIPASLAFGFGAVYMICAVGVYV